MALRLTLDSMFIRGGAEPEVQMKFFRMCCSAIALVVLISPAVRVEGANPRSGRITIPVMTPLTVKLDEAINFKTAENGGGFTASLARPVDVDGITVVPAGSSAAGLIHKGPECSIELNSVFVNGRSYRVTSSPIAINQKKPIRPGTTFTFNLTLSVSIAR